MPEKNQFTGRVEKILETQTFPSGFQKRVLVVNDGHEKYPQTIPFEFVKERCDALDNLTEGEAVTVYYNIRGNEYNGRYYVSLQGWKFEGAGDALTPSPAPASEKTAKVNPSIPKTTEEVEQYEEDPDNDIPF